MLRANEKNRYFGNKLRTILLAACVLSCIGAVSASAQQVGLALNSGSGSRGGRVTLNVSLSDSGGAQPASLEWSMKYSATDITGITVSAGPAASAAEKSILCNSGGGSTTCILSGLNFGAISPGIVATATFQISSGTQSSSIPIQVANTFAASGDGSAISASGTSGTISFGTQTVLSGFSCSPGSVNTPGTVTCTVSIGGAAPSVAFPVSLSTNNASVTGPGSVSIGAGSTSANFTVNVAKVLQNATATLTATASGVSKTFSLNLAAAGSSSPPPSVSLSSLSCTPSTLGSGASTLCTATLTGVTGSTISLGLKTSNSLINIPSSVSVAAGSLSAKFTATAGTVTSNQIGTLTAAYGGISKAFTLSLARAVASQTTNVFSASSVPGTVTDGDNNSVELGMKFRSDIAGTVTGIRFYKGPYNNGTHTGHLWTKSGSLLGTVTFPNESSSGWQQANFATPISIQANTTYIVSYYAPSGHYSSDQNFFRSAVDSAPLHGLQDGADGSNGVYRYGSSGFPNLSWNASNYWVDLVFSSVVGSGIQTSGSSSASGTLSASLWPPQTIPTITSASDSQSVELGMKFRSDVAGTITGIRFYKGAGNTGTHVGHIWSSNGALLASVTFTQETSSGWQQAGLAKPVAIQPNTTYVVSYFAPNGHYAANIQFFGRSADDAPLHAPADGQSGGNGVFTYGASGFPNQTWNASNYWVDVVFAAGGDK